MVDNVEAGESLSALMDEELEHHQQGSMITHLCRDSQHQRSWQHFNLISDVLKKNLPSHVSADFCQKVSLALEQEPTILAPHHRRPLRLTPFVRQVTGLGIAASVTAAAILGTQYFVDTPGFGTAPVAQIQAAPDAQQFERIAIPELRQPMPSSVNKYLVNHNQHAAGVQGVLPYARIIGYRPENSEK